MLNFLFVGLQAFNLDEPFENLMKKIIITLIVLSFAFGVKAQQLQVLPKQQPLKPFKFSPDSLSRNNLDNMPIARMQGNSNMPIVQTDRTAYNMPAAGMNQPGVYTMKKPGASPEVLPFFGGKPPVYYEFKKYPDNTPPADSTKK